MMDLRVEQRDREGIRILDLRGPVVIGRSESLLRSTVLNLAKEATINIILNLASVTEIDDDGLGVLIVCHASLRRTGGALKLLKPTRVHMELFVLMKLEGVFETFLDEQDAVNSFFPERAVPSRFLGARLCRNSGVKDASSGMMVVAFRGLFETDPLLVLEFHQMTADRLRTCRNAHSLRRCAPPRSDFGEQMPHHPKNSDSRARRRQQL